MPGKCPFSLVDAKTGQPFNPPSFPMRSDIPPVPEMMQYLPVDVRGYPVPFFVLWVEGQAEFRGTTKEVAKLCVDYELCWVCGRPMAGLTRAFVIGPMCSVNRISAEPPAHIECSRYSVVACPFLTKPQMVRRENDMPANRNEGPGIPLKHNPGVMLLWFVRDTKGYEILHETNGLLWHFTRDPIGVEWYTRGRRANRQECLDAFDIGLPKLLEAAAQDDLTPEVPGWVKRAHRLLPRQ